jgi:hypothetical protein
MARIQERVGEGADAMEIAECRIHRRLGKEKQGQLRLAIRH